MSTRGREFIDFHHGYSTFQLYMTPADQIPRCLFRKFKAPIHIQLCTTPIVVHHPTLTPRAACIIAAAECCYRNRTVILISDETHPIPSITDFPLHVVTSYDIYSRIKIHDFIRQRVEEWPGTMFEVFLDIPDTRLAFFAHTIGVMVTDAGGALHSNPCVFVSSYAPKFDVVLSVDGAFVESPIPTKAVSKAAWEFAALHWHPHVSAIMPDYEHFLVVSEEEEVAKNAVQEQEQYGPKITAVLDAQRQYCDKDKSDTNHRFILVVDDLEFREWVKQHLDIFGSSESCFVCSTVPPFSFCRELIRFPEASVHLWILNQSKAGAKGIKFIVAFLTGFFGPKFLSYRRFSSRESSVKL